MDLPIKFYCDNKATINISLNPMQHDKTKHIEVDRHIIKENVKEWIICITYIPTKEQTVDNFNKEQPQQNFENFISKLNIINIYDLTWRGVQKSL